MHFVVSDTKVTNTDFTDDTERVVGQLLQSHLQTPHANFFLLLFFILYLFVLKFELNFVSLQWN